jgi:hypothetical protein
VFLGGIETLAVLEEQLTYWQQQLQGVADRRRVVFGELGEDFGGEFWCVFLFIEFIGFFKPLLIIGLKAGIKILGN